VIKPLKVPFYDFRPFFFYPDGLMKIAMDYHTEKSSRLALARFFFTPVSRGWF
jgi:hypothetical protein